MEPVRRYRKLNRTHDVRVDLRDHLVQVHRGHLLTHEAHVEALRTFSSLAGIEGVIDEILSEWSLARCEDLRVPSPDAPVWTTGAVDVLPKDQPRSRGGGQ